MAQTGEDRALTPVDSGPRLPPPWQGSNFHGWLRLLARNRFRVDARFLPRVVGITAATLRNTMLRQIQQRIWGERVATTTLERPPLFVLGHWRSGTTWLHEVLTLDLRHTYPSTYACMSPNHFLLTEHLMTGSLRFALPTLPSRRPMDAMAMGWDHPNEDEWALCHLGQPSPYSTSAFPNHPPQHPEYLDLERVPPPARERWKACFLGFLKQLTVRDPRRIVLKSPTHTYRIKVLLELFPEAQFVHIVRNPYEVFSSTIKLLKTLYTNFGLQQPRFLGLEEYVIARFVHLHERLGDGVGRLKPGQFHEVRYEDLVGDPVRETRAIYDHLALGDFDAVLLRLRRYVAEVHDHQAGRYRLTPAVRERIDARWGHVIRRYGYAGDERRQDGGGDHADP